MSSIRENDADTSGGSEPRRLLATPLARRIARERKLNLAHIRGSGPRGRIIAADVHPAPAAGPGYAKSDGVQTSALVTALDLMPIDTMLETFSRAGLSLDFEDVIIRATSSALSALYGSADDPDASIYLELADLNLRFDGAGTMSLSAIHNTRLEGSSAEQPDTRPPLSIRILDADGVTPIVLPPLPGFAMRLIIAAAAGGGEATATLFYNEGRVAVEFAASILASLKQRLELPILLLL